MPKTIISVPIFGPNLGQHFFFFRNLAPSVAKYHGQLSSRAISERTNYPILRKLSDGWTGQTDESDFIGRFPTNAKRPTTP